MVSISITFVVRYTKTSKLNGEERRKYPSTLSNPVAYIETHYTTHFETNLGDAVR